MNKKIYIGTSGWAYDWDTLYPADLPKKKWLTFYSKQFNSVEINYSFYRLPSKNTYKKWVKQTSRHFLFALKLSRYITHIKRLNNVRKSLKKFIMHALALNHKCGPILVQLPSYFKINTDRLEEFLITTVNINKTLKVNIQYAFEFRHESWFNNPTVLKLLHDYHAALVFSHAPGEFPYPDEEPVTTNFVYLRMHGPGRLYASSYSNPELKQWAKKILYWHNQRKTVYVYFNNDARGYAPANAKTLIKILKS